MVMNLGFQAQFLQRKTHRRADVVQGVYRRHRKVTAFDSGPVTGIAVFVAPARVPRAFVRIDRIKCALHIVVPAHVIENEEFVFWSEKGLVGNTC